MTRSTRPAAPGGPQGCSRGWISCTAGRSRFVRRFLLLVLVACVALVSAPSALGAGTDGTYRGRTSQGYKTHMVVKGGLVKSVNIPWLGHCRRKNVVWGPMTKFWWTDPPSQGDSFSDGGRIHRNQAGEKAVIIAHLHGRFSGDRVSGTQTTSVRFRSADVGRNFCKAKIRWSARLVPSR
jgi:hypothetical protein